MLKQKGFLYRKPLKWYHQESNRGHKDFQSFALPTELWYRSVVITGAKVQLFFKHANVFTKKTQKKLLLQSNLSNGI